LPTVNLDEIEKHTQRCRVTEYNALGTLLAVISFGLSDPSDYLALLQPMIRPSARQRANRRRGLTAKPEGDIEREIARLVNPVERRRRE
jgi:hypothetical protein